MYGALAKTQTLKKGSRFQNKMTNGISVNERKKTVNKDLKMGIFF